MHPITTFEVITQACLQNQDSNIELLFTSRNPVIYSVTGRGWLEGSSKAMASGGTKCAVIKNWQKASFTSILHRRSGKHKSSVLTGNLS